jgi:GGDEF domain-containing protein
MDNALTAPAVTGLLVADTDETQSYVFESSRLPEIRGASQQLDALNRRARDLAENAGGDVVYAGGGSLLALMAADHASQTAEAIERLYREKTYIATTSAAFRPLPADYQNHSFGDYVRWAGHWLRRHKESKAPPPFIETLPHQSLCQSCQRRPANVIHFSIYEAPLCNVCQTKYQAGRRRGDQHTWHNRFDAWLKQKNDGSYESYYRHSANQDVVVPQTVDELSQAAQGRSGYVGFLYLDGDHIGDLLAEMQTKKAYKILSKTLSAVTRDAVFGALADELSPALVEESEFRRQLGLSSRKDGKALIHPFEIITIGGDDVLLIVPAHAAIPIAKRIGVAFGDRVANKVHEIQPGYTDPVSMSAGVVIADDHTPAQLMFDLAKQLLKEAKKQGAALDFHVLKSADMVDRAVEALREQYPYYLEKAGDRTKDIRLLARPYRYDQIDILWAGLDKLRKQGFPSSQMALLSRALMQGRRESTLFYQYQYQRGKRDKNRDEYGTLEDVLMALQKTDNRDPLPWQTVEGEKYSHKTVLWDIAELYDFIPGGRPND